MAVYYVICVDDESVTSLTEVLDKLKRRYIKIKSIERHGRMVRIETTGAVAPKEEEEEEFPEEEEELEETF
jgi:translation initiation factor 6 (eIF-6)